MAGIRDFLRKNPIAGGALAVGLLAVVGYMLAGSLFGGGRTSRPSPAPAAAPPAVTPAPAVTPPAVAPAPVVPPAPTGRVDPFLPLVKAAAATPGRPSPGPSSGPSGTPPPPLPPPPFPVPPGAPLPPPPLPGAPPAPAPTPPPPPPPEAGISVVGIIADTTAVAIITINGRTEIVAEGEQIGDLRVVKIDPVRRTVTFIRAGKRFVVSMGGE